MGGSISKGAGGRDPRDLYDSFSERLTPVAGEQIQQIQDLFDNLDGNPFLGFEQAISATQNIGTGAQQALQGTRRDLIAAAGASQDAAGRAAIQAARTAAGGRGGLAYGGGAGAIAAQAASGAASAQGAALSQALAQTGLAQAQAAGQADLARAQGLAGIGGQQAQLFQQQQQFVTQGRIAPRQQFVQGLFNIAQAGTSGSGGSPSTRARSFGKQGL